MQRAITLSLCAIVFPLLLPLRAAPAEDAANSKKLFRSAVDRISKEPGGYVFGIVPGSDVRDSSKRLMDALAFYRRKPGPLVIISTDPGLAARITQMAFSSCRPASLQGLTVVCLISQRYDSYLRPSATAAGAKLLVEPLPR
jgi:hypothetical protein